MGIMIPRKYKANDVRMLWRVEIKGIYNRRTTSDSTMTSLKKQQNLLDLIFFLVENATCDYGGMWLCNRVCMCCNETFLWKGVSAFKYDPRKNEFASLCWNGYQRRPVVDICNTCLSIYYHEACEFVREIKDGNVNINRLVHYLIKNHSPDIYNMIEIMETEPIKKELKYSNSHPDMEYCSIPQKENTPITKTKVEFSIPPALHSVLEVLAEEVSVFVEKNKYRQDIAEFTDIG